MQLCQLCQSIPFASLPIFPKDDRYAVGNGGSNIVVLIAKPGDPGDDATTAKAAESHKVKHHPNLDSLREAAAGGCELCVLILGEAEPLLAGLGELGDEGSPGRAAYPTPSFDMWLTKRPEGLDGFWVVSGPRESKAPTPFKMLLLVAAFGFVVDQGDPMASVIPGRPVKNTVDSGLLERVARRLTDCDEVHGGCQRPVEDVPERLLDLYASTSASGDVVKLVELGPIARAKYAALSYASESGITRCSGTGTADSNGISVAALPKTFQDAILVARSLGLQYLWIDSLCVPGNLEEWQRSSPEAGAVYANAYVTISATGTSDTSQGLFAPRAERKYAHIPYVSEAGASGTVLAFSLPRPKEVQREQHIQMGDEPASAGVWTFQERVLSPRVVHFASDQVYHDGGAARRSEGLSAGVDDCGSLGALVLYRR
ncbi:hypothetical protein NLG97_g10444 [Lecanicillium saksenae]|uniref:Uncharacterized protein n=1 Tax=Lecanicillium saksenae TaxID=468837 RepID=A0ACC1QG60_9HYPO|nr:hypothetical protein NLG97_g10444 [Lecanicillium saksenae]